MPRYKTTRAYAAERGGREITAFGPWTEGTEVELDDPADAEWVNRDAGAEVLVEFKGKAAAAKKAPAKGGGSAASTEDDSGLTKGG